MQGEIFRGSSSFLGSVLGLKLIEVTSKVTGAVATM